MTALDIKVEEEEEERKKDTVGILLAAKIPLFSANGAPIVAFVTPIPAIVRRSHANNRDSTTVVVEYIVCYRSRACRTLLTPIKHISGYISNGAAFVSRQGTAYTHGMYITYIISR